MTLVREAHVQSLENYNTSLDLSFNGTARVPRERYTDTVRLDGAKPLQLLGSDRNFLPKTNLACRTPDKTHPVGIQTLMARRVGPNARNFPSAGRYLRLLGKPPLTERLDHCGLHGEFDPVKRDEPQNVLHGYVSAPCIEGRARNRNSRTQTQTMPIQPPLIPWILVKPQLA